MTHQKTQSYVRFGTSLLHIRQPRRCDLERPFCTSGEWGFGDEKLWKFEGFWKVIKSFHNEESTFQIDPCNSQKVVLHLVNRGKLPFGNAL